MRKLLFLTLAALPAILAPFACTNDYDSFDTQPSGVGGVFIDAGDGSTAAGSAGKAGGGVGGAAGSSGTAGTGQGGTAGTTGQGGAAGQAGGGECGADQKSCQSSCVSVNDPAFGCTATGCDPCDLANATATCDKAACKVASCAAGFGDCNQDANDGCEATFADSANNCGACGTACTGGLICASGMCGCQDNASCSKVGASGTCNNFLCTCDSSTCVLGEICEKIQGTDRCRCNGGTRCESDEVCCPKTGCKDLTSDKDNCGACGRKCANDCNNGACT
jgi:hypothetical protein